MKRAVFLDRDGVLNRVTVDAAGIPHPPASVAELELERGAAVGCRRLKEAGWLLVAVTNQPDIARGTARAEDVAEINARLVGDLGLDDLVICPHDDDDGCSCRKPQPGMLLDAASRLEIDVAESVLVGDRSVDVEAARRAGCRAILISRPYSGEVEADATAADLADAASWIIDRETSTKEADAAAIA